MTDLISFLLPAFPDWAVYLVQVNIYLIVLVLFYMLLLRHNTFYNWNRWFFILGIFSAFILAGHSLWSSIAIESPIRIQQIVGGEIQLDGKLGFWRLRNILTIAYLAGVAGMSFRLFTQIFSLIALAKRLPKIVLQGVHILELDKPLSPFSFFNWIFVSPTLHTDEELTEILYHEQQHVARHHSLDIILIEVLTVICWMNPFVWLMKWAIKQNIEYEVDAKLLIDGIDRKHYQYHLLKISQTEQQSFATNNFNYQHLKKRIVMMNKKKSARINLIQYAFVLPLLLILSIVCNARISEPVHAIKPNDQISNDLKSLGFNKLTHDFGVIREIDGDASALFTFVNNTDQPVVVNNVTAACGCTTPEWTKGVIAPGKNGYIKAIYGAKGRVGAFDKTVSVSTSANTKPIVLHIKGTVVN